MIFVTTGMATQGFERLVRKMDEIAGRINEETIMQIGHTKYKPVNAKYFDFTTLEEIRELCRRARIVVTHGAMTIPDALGEGTPVIAVPRLKKYEEVIDDHQLDFARALEKDGKVRAIYDLDDLEEVLGEAGIKPGELTTDGRLVNALKGYIAQFERG